MATREHFAVVTDIVSVDVIEDDRGKVIKFLPALILK